jgi:sulfatase maturation enzyme AslB (radical SAM superfamily)
MPWVVLRRAVELIAASSHPRPVFVLYGGEPLMARDLVERAVLLARKSEDPDRPISIRLPTNGTLLDLELVDFLDEHEVEVQMSFDGVPAAQALRSPGSYSILDDLLQELRERRPAFLRDRVRAAVTVSSAAVAHLSDSVHYLSGFGFGEVTMTPLFSHDPGWTDASTKILDRELDQIRRRCAWRLQETGQISFTPLRRYRQEIQPQPAEDDTVCTAPEGSRLAVDVDGSLAPCLLVAPSIAPDSPSPLAEALALLTRGTIEDPWSQAIVTSFQSDCRSTGLFHGREKKYSSWSRCLDCEFQDDCRPCPVATAWIPGNSDPDRIPDHLCAFNRTLAAHRRRMPEAATDLEKLRGEAPLPRALQRLLARSSHQDGSAAHESPAAGATEAP